MSCNKKKDEEIIKKINIEQAFADLKFRKMREDRFGLSSCCNLDKLDKLSAQKELCDWDDNKVPIYLDKKYKDKDDDSTYKWNFESTPIPDWVLKACTPCTEYSSVVTTTTASMTLTLTSTIINSSSDYIPGTTKVYALAKYDGTAASTYFTIGYGVLPGSGNFSLTIYGNTNTVDPKNGADNAEVLKIIIDVNGDGSVIKSVDYSAVGWTNQAYTTSATVQPSAAGTITTECTYGIATDCTFCGEARKNDPDMYFFYDTTSLGRQEVIDTHNVVETWITGLRDLGAFNGKVYHTSVLGERWLDWAIVPFTGQFNNAGYCGGSYSPGVGTGSVIGPQNPSWGNNPPTGGYVDAVTPPTSNTNTIEWGVLDYFINVKEIDWFNGGNTTSTVTYTGTGASGDSVTSPGPPPIASSKRILVVVFADEATSPQPYPQPYHVNVNTAAPDWTNATGGVNGTQAVPTPCWSADYDEFVLQHNKFLNQGSDYEANYFIYPAYPKSVADSHKSFPLHVVGAIDSGINNTGILASAPANGIVSLAQTTSGTNPYVQYNVGRLDQYNWGYNVSQPPAGFTQVDFETNLEAFWDPGDEECVGDVECLVIYVKDTEGNPIECYPIYIDNKEVGVTDEDGYFTHSIPNASVDKKHSIDLCHCFDTTGGCSQQRIDITVTPQETKIKCTKQTIDCTPEE